MNTINLGSVIRWCAGIFLITLGILELNAQQALLPGIGTVSLPFGAGNEVLNVIAALIELGAGIVIILASFRVSVVGVHRILIPAVAVVWLLRIIYSFLFQNPPTHDFLFWLNELSIESRPRLAFLS